MQFITQDLDLWVDAHKLVPFGVGLLVIIWVLSLFLHHPDSAMGALVRICGSLIGAVVVMLLVWQRVGGWLPPAAAFIGFTGLSLGVMLAAIHVYRGSKKVESRQLDGLPEETSASFKEKVDSFEKLVDGSTNGPSSPDKEEGGCQSPLPTGMSGGAALPKESDFPAGTTFVVKEFDVPLTWIPARGWFNWYGGAPRRYDPQFLTVANNWPADSFEEWVRIVESSLPQTPLIVQPDPPQST